MSLVLLPLSVACAVSDACGMASRAQEQLCLDLARRHAADLGFVFLVSTHPYM